MDWWMFCGFDFDIYSFNKFLLMAQLHFTRCFKPLIIQVRAVYLLSLFGTFACIVLSYNQESEVLGISILPISSLLQQVYVICVVELFGNIADIYKPLNWKAGL